MKLFIKKALPGPFYQILKRVYYLFVKMKYLILGRVPVEAESSKAKPRRLREGFFDKYCQGRGLDIGFGGDIVHSSATGWDFEHGDAQILTSIPNSSFNYVYSSHTLEHMINPSLALHNWWRAVKPGGYLILYVPERNLYEKKTQLPSKWNLDHKHFFLLENDEPPVTLGVIPLLARAINGYEIIYAKVCDEGYVSGGPDCHSNGEYSIEVVLRKNSL